jgi:adenylate cyclase class 2
MLKEHEAKILDVDPGVIEARILASGGRHVGGPVLMRRFVYDITPGDESRWIRLRASGDLVTVAVKHIVNDGIDGTEEIEVRVDNFDAMSEILSQLGFTPKAYQENRRTSYKLGTAKLNIDEWPLLRPYLEIEADSTEAVIRVAALLGYTEESLRSFNTLRVYAASGLDLLAYRRLTFDGADESATGEK